MGQPSIYHATVALSFQIEICNLDRTKSSFLATSLHKKVIFTKTWVTRSCRPSDDMLHSYYQVTCWVGGGGGGTLLPILPHNLPFPPLPYPKLYCSYTTSDWFISWQHWPCFWGRSSSLTEGMRWALERHHLCTCDRDAWHYPRRGLSGLSGWAEMQREWTVKGLVHFPVHSMIFDAVKKSMIFNN